MTQTNFIRVHKSFSDLASKQRFDILRKKTFQQITRNKETPSAEF